MIKINKDDYQSGRNNKNFFILCLQSSFITEGYQLKLEVLILICIYNIYYIFFENIDDEGFQNLGIFSSFKAFKGGLFIVPHLLCDGASVFAVSCKGPSQFSHL